MTFALAAFVPGLALGSFLNVVAARVPLRRSIVRPASACMSCATPIAPLDLASGMTLEFHAPDLETFPLLAHARDAGCAQPSLLGAGGG